MESINKNHGKRHREKIISLIKQKDTSLAELKKNTTLQAIHYHIPELCKEGGIRAYVKGTGLKDEDIFYTFVNNYESPQDILKLINKMCDDDKPKAAQAFPEFVKLCIEKGAEEKEAEKLAYALMSNYVSGLKEKVAFHFTSYEKLEYFFKIISFNDIEEYIKNFLNRMDRTLPDDFI